VFLHVHLLRAGEGNQDIGETVKILAIRPLSDFGDLWPGGKYSAYYHSITGLLEYVLVRALLHTAERMESQNKLDINYGDMNSMGLYLCHWAYSPFVEYAGPQL
jgi:hypothetical protein